jgi:hypothetical protein
MMTKRSVGVSCEDRSMAAGRSCTSEPHRAVFASGEFTPTAFAAGVSYIPHASTAFMKWHVEAVAALRAPDFHTIGPDGVTRDRAAMEQHTQGLLNGIK